MTNDISFRDILELLVSISEAGYSEYTQISKSNFDDDICVMFGELAEQELQHREIYKFYLNSETSFYNSRIQGEYSLFLEGLMYTIDEFLDRTDINNVNDAFDFAFGLEKNTMILLNEIKELMPVTETQRVEKIIAVEQRHIVYLFEMKKMKRAS